MTGLVSVAIPTFNAAQTIPMALGSLLAQDYQEWEALVVDDGSNDETLGIVNSFTDCRIRYFRFEKNMGRPAARSKALDEARGQYLAMLDADDWWVPSKLQEQISVLEERPDVVLVSTGMAITDEEGSLCGVRAFGNSAERWPFVMDMPIPSIPRVAHAPSVLRMDAAKSANYDLRLPVAQDVDFLIQVLRGNRYTVIAKPLYVYSERSSANPGKILKANRLVRYILAKYWTEHPVIVGRQIAAAYLKGFIYRFLFAAGLADWVISRRSRRPSASETEAFLEASEKVCLAAGQFSISRSDLGVR